MTVTAEKEALERLLAKRSQVVTTHITPLAKVAEERAFTEEETERSETAKRELQTIDDMAAQLRAEIAIQDAHPSIPEQRTGSTIAEQLREVLVERSKKGTVIDLGADLQRALSPTVTGAGKELQPTTFAQSLVTPLRQLSGLIQAGASTLVTTSGEEIIFPRVKSFGAAAKKIAPNTTIGGTDPQFDQVSSKVSKYGQLVLIPRELSEDSVINIESFVGELIGQNVAFGVDQDGVTDLLPGADKPNAVTITVEGAGVAPTFDDIIDLEHSVIAPYRVGAAFLVAPGAVKGLRKLKDTTGRYLWQPSLQAGAPAVIDGFPVYEDPFLPDPGAGQASILFGRFSAAKIRMVSSVRVERSEEFAFDKDQVAFRGLLRAGLFLDDANALAAFTGKAA